MELSQYSILTHVPCTFTKNLTQTHNLLCICGDSNPSIHPSTLSYVALSIISLNFNGTYMNVYGWLLTQKLQHPYRPTYARKERAGAQDSRRQKLAGR